jgi:hypothetical protein
VIGEDGKVRRSRPTRTLGFCTGPYAITEKSAHRKAWDDWLSKLDQSQMCPQSIMSVQDFVDRYFRPEHVRLKKPAGQIHYETMFQHILPDLGRMRLCDVNLGEVQRLLSDKLGERYDLGKVNKRTGTYSVQTVRHIRNTVSANGSSPPRRIAPAPPGTVGSTRSVSRSEPAERGACAPRPLLALSLMWRADGPHPTAQPYRALIPISARSGRVHP